MGGKYGDDHHLSPQERGGLNAEEAAPADDLDDLGMTVDYQGIDLQEAELPSERRRDLELELDGEEDLDFRISPDLLDKTNDPVKLYLRQMGEHYTLTRVLEEKLAGINPRKNPKQHRRHRWKIGRRKILASRLMRSIKYTHVQRKRLVERVIATTDTMRSLDRQIQHFKK